MMKNNNHGGKNVVLPRHGQQHHTPEEDRVSSSTAVAIDRDKNSQEALRWAVDHLATSSVTIILIHVVILPATLQAHVHGESSSGSSSSKKLDGEITGLIRSHRLYCARKGITTKRVILEDVDVTKALIDYITAHYITTIVCGASNRNALTRKLTKTPDVPTGLLDHAPDFCGVYVIRKQKTLTVRSAKSQPPIPKHLPRQTPNAAIDPGPGDSVRSPFDRKGYWIRPIPKQEAKVVETKPQELRHKKVDGGGYGKKTRPFQGSSSRESSLEDLKFDFSSSSNDGSHNSNSSPRNTKVLEAEMKRLRQELKQTMDMYSTVRKEAIAAKQTAEELRQLKMEETRRWKETRKVEEAALAMVEMEKARVKEAMEVAEAAKKLAEAESKKRVDAERVARREAQEKKKAVEALAHNDVRYRRYSIQEIEAATDDFADWNKIGEGGYGPVYKGTLDHTPVAIKVLRPDAAQGRKQFQQEVEVLSSIRHPNMVLLLGACPEYGCLVYEYMDNGSLDDRLFRRGSTPPLPWPLRFKIAAEVTTALHFLHQSKPEPLVHRDLKPPNILLDSNFISKISDVGLARLVPPSVANKVTATVGTFCYIDPEYQKTGLLGTKSDVYSLGILLLQLVTAKAPMGLANHVQRAIRKGGLKDVLDPMVVDWPMDETVTFAKVALRCAELRRKDRPDLAKVVIPELNRLRAFGQEWESKNRVVVVTNGPPPPFGKTPVGGGGDGSSRRRVASS